MPESLPGNSRPPHSLLLRVADVASRPLQILHVSTARCRGISSGLLLHTRVARFLIVATVGVLASGPNSGPIEPKEEGDTAASQAEEAKEGRGPLVTKTVVHLLCEENDSGAP